jgi:uncharacterized paraquat-inducible protein A
VHGSDCTRACTYISPATSARKGTSPTESASVLEWSKRFKPVKVRTMTGRQVGSALERRRVWQSVLPYKGRLRDHRLKGLRSRACASHAVAGSQAHARRCLHCHEPRVLRHRHFAGR